MAGYDQDLSRIVEELNRAAPGSRVADKPSAARPPQNAGSLDQLLAYAGRQNASDLLLIAGTPVALRVNGTLARRRTAALPRRCAQLRPAVAGFPPVR